MSKRSFDGVEEDVMGLTEEEGDTENEAEEERRVMIRVVPREIFETTSFVHLSNSTSCTDAGGGGCQADECGADLKDAKQYHRRHRVCEPHAKAAFVLVKGIRQRFCQQCSRFHEISKFDGTKRSCRDRLAGHNLRRRKVVQADQEAEDVKRLPTSSSNISNKNSRVKMEGVRHPMERELILQSCSSTSTTKNFPTR